jgi:hypothetical protein
VEIQLDQGSAAAAGMVVAVGVAEVVVHSAHSKDTGVPHDLVGHIIDT